MKPSSWVHVLAQCQKLNKIVPERQRERTHAKAEPQVNVASSGKFCISRPQMGKVEGRSKKAFKGLESHPK